MTRKQLLKQIADAKKQMQKLAKLYPEAFTKDGKPIVATASFPK